MVPPLSETQGKLGIFRQWWRKLALVGKTGGKLIQKVWTVWTRLWPRGAIQCLHWHEMRRFVEELWKFGSSSKEIEISQYSMKFNVSNFLQQHLIIYLKGWRLWKTINPTNGNAKCFEYTNSKVGWEGPSETLRFVNFSIHKDRHKKFAQRKHFPLFAILKKELPVCPE